MHPNTERHFRERLHALGDHPLFGQYGLELAKASRAHTAELLKKRWPGGRFNDMQVMQLYMTILRLESAHREELQTEAIRVTSEIWGIPPEKLRALLTDEVDSGAEEPGGEDEEVEAVRDATDELSDEDRAQINHRIMMNTLTQGAAVHQYASLHHAAGEVVKRIDPNLAKLYDQLIAASLERYWSIDISQLLEMMTQGAVGSETLEWDEEVEDNEDTPTVVAKATCFPVLLQELAKGVMEILTSTSRGADPHMQEKTDRHADKFEHELLQLMVGPELWRKFLAALKQAGVPTNQIPHIIRSMSDLKPNQAMRIISLVIESPGDVAGIFKGMTTEPPMESTAAPAAPTTKPVRPPMRPIPTTRPNEPRPGRPDPFKIPKPNTAPRPKNCIESIAESIELFEATDPKTKNLPALEKAAKKLNLPVQELFELAIKADPTARLKQGGEILGCDYLSWIVRQMTFENVRLPEDNERLKTALGQFDKAKRSGAIQIERDINKYKFGGRDTQNAAQLLDLEEVLDALSGKKSKRQTMKQMKLEGTEDVKETANYKLLQILTPEAASVYSKNTRWCTSNAGTAKNYMRNNGGLFLIFKKEPDGSMTKLAQMTGDYTQIQNVLDQGFREMNPEIEELIKPEDTAPGSMLAGYSTKINKRMPQWEQKILTDDALKFYKFRAEIPGVLEKVLRDGTGTDLEALLKDSPESAKAPAVVALFDKYSDKPAVLYVSIKSGRPIDDRIAHNIQKNPQLLEQLSSQHGSKCDITLQTNPLMQRWLSQDLELALKAAAACGQISDPLFQLVMHDPEARARLGELMNSKVALSKPQANEFFSEVVQKKDAAAALKMLQGSKYNQTLHASMREAFLPFIYENPAAAVQLKEKLPPEAEALVFTNINYARDYIISDDHHREHRIGLMWYGKNHPEALSSDDLKLLIKKYGSAAFDARTVDNITDPDHYLVASIQLRRPSKRAEDMLLKGQSTPRNLAIYFTYVRQTPQLREYILDNLQKISEATGVHIMSALVKTLRGGQ